MYSASGTITEINPDNKTITVTLKEKYIDDFNGYESVILECGHLMKDTEKMKRIYVGNLLQFNYFPSFVNGNIVSDVVINL